MKVDDLLEAKGSKQEAGYIPRPNNGQKCINCTMWRDPNKCSAVAGNIDPNGWCEWYAGGAYGKRGKKVKENNLADLLSNDYPLFLEDVRRIKNYALYMDLVEAELVGIPINESIDKNSIEILEKCKKLTASNPTIGNDYSYVFLIFDANSNLHILENNENATLENISNNQYTFSDGKTYPDERWSKLSYSSLYIFDDSNKFEKFKTIIRLKFNSVVENSVVEAFDTDVEWVSEPGPGGSTVYAAKIEDAYIEITYKPLDNGVYVSFTRGGRMSVTGEGNQNKIFGAVINHMKKWADKNKPEKIMFSAFKPNTGAFGSQDTTRSGLYSKMVQRFASQNGYDYSVEDTGSEDTFILTKRNIDATTSNQKIKNEISIYNTLMSEEYKDGDYARGGKPMPKAKKGRTKHPLHGKLVGS